MAKFTALQPISNLILPGLAILSNPNGVRFDDIEGDGFTAQSSGGIGLEIGGSGFKGAFGRPKATGTVTEIKYFSDGTPFYKLKDAKYAFSKLADSNDTAKHTEKIFAKKDTITGSFGNDTLYGFNGDDTINGKGGADYLYGNDGEDVLNGGDAADYLDGGKGKDTYLFKADPITGYDTIVKFQKGERIELKAKFFAGLELGELAAEHFVVGTAAKDVDDHILYSASSGLIYFDADGATEGGVSPVAFAKVQPGLDHLGAESFFVI
jgi:Ca2+-binding RTX toxin-like protein